MELAPIVLFTYNRFHHTVETLKALKANELAEASDVLVYSDGPKTLEDRGSVDQIRGYLRALGGFKSVTVIERPRNLGLARSIITGVTEVLNSYGKAIILEDDLLTSRFFLKFMNEALELYENEEEVISITGYTYTVRSALPETFFLSDPGCWGWATWNRGWRVFKEDGRALVDALSKAGLLRQFNYNYSYPYSKMLENSISGKNESWAIRWYASAFLKNYLTLYPGMSLVHNIGNDHSGVHSLRSNLYDVKLSDKTITVAKIPVSENRDARRAFEAYFRSLKRPIAQRVIRILAKLNG
jgi:hypothetical protein